MILTEILALAILPIFFLLKKVKFGLQLENIVSMELRESKAIHICHINKIPCIETNFTFEDIKDCEEAFVTGTFAGIIPVSKIEKIN